MTDGSSRTSPGSSVSSRQSDKRKHVSELLNSQGFGGLSPAGTPHFFLVVKLWVYPSSFVRLAAQTSVFPKVSILCHLWIWCHFQMQNRREDHRLGRRRQKEEIQESGLQRSRNGQEENLETNRRLCPITTIFLRTSASKGSEFSFTLF